MKVQQVKHFMQWAGRTKHSRDFQDAINEFLNNPNITVIDIRYSTQTCLGTLTLTALIIYELEKNA